MAGLYLHIPFCRSRCIYCGFYSTTLLSLQNRYVDALCQEMKTRAQNGVSTIYLGGGTPSLLTARNLEKIFNCIQLAYPDSQIQENHPSTREVTIECNPDDVSDELCTILLHTPVNRVSMGAQTFCNKRLRFLQRRHTSAQVDEAVQRLRAIGIRNISIDLMFGFPGETLKEWLSDIDHVLTLNPEHISAYSLMYEKDTPLDRLYKKGKVKMINDELALAMYEQLIDRLTDAGYEHYEISNFARPGYRSRHNSSYWNQTPYIGIGAAAHSYDGQGIRSWNVANILQYITAIEHGTLPSELEVLDDRTRYNDLITTALRTCEGICLETLSPHFQAYLLTSARRNLDAGLLTLENTSTAHGETRNIRLTRRGLFVSDDVMSDLIYV